MKKTIALFSICLLLCASCLSTTASEYIYSYLDYDYIILEDGTVEITAYNGDEQLVEIPTTIDGKTVTSIGDYALMDCSSIQAIALPDSINHIGNGAFHGTSFFNDINNWENGVLYIDDYLICAKLSIYNDITWEDEVFTEVSGNYIIKSNTRVIADYAFSYCESVNSISMSDSVLYIGKSAFNHCTALSNITLSNSVEYIGPYTFSSCAIKSVTLPNSVTTIDNYAFTDCQLLESVVFNNSIEQINQGAFLDCVSLTEINIPNSLKSIGNSAFENCSKLSTVKLGNNMEAIGGWVFYNTKFYNELSNWQNGVLYIDNYLISAQLIKYNKDTFKDEIITQVSGNYNVADNTTIISAGAFADCTDLLSINLPNSVKRIGRQAFSYCENLNKINIPDSVTTIDELAFYDCELLKSITIPNSVKIIGKKSLGYYYNDSTGSDEVASDFYIYCYGHSAAHNYASDNLIAYILLDYDYSTTAPSSDTSATKAVYGDCNDDDKINMADVLILRKYIAKWNVSLNLDNSDCNADKKINMADVLILRKYIAKWDVVLGPQK